MGEVGRAPELGFTRSLGDLWQLGRWIAMWQPHHDAWPPLQPRYKSYGVTAEPDIFKLEKERSCGGPLTTRDFDRGTTFINFLSLPKYA